MRASRLFQNVSRMVLAGYIMQLSNPSWSMMGQNELLEEFRYSRSVSEIIQMFEASPGEQNTRGKDRHNTSPVRSTENRKMPEIYQNASFDEPEILHQTKSSCTTPLTSQKFLESHPLELPELVLHVCTFLESLRDIVAYGLASKSVWEGVTSFPHERHETIYDNDQSLIALSHSIRVTSLNFWYNAWDFSGETIDFLSKAIWLKSVVFLNGLPDLSIFAGYTDLTSLNLWSDCIDMSDACAAIATSPYLVKLISLKIQMSIIDDEGAKAIATSPYLKSLTKLNLIGSKISVEGKKLLKNRFGDMVSF